ncbi:MAG: helix-turn-helix domain-containing protein [Tannerella sp.]|jgi:y4mF family transcriptional regulator|nr:helix-turn-helix domain-containing protein [Tannerella sp.]
MNNIGNIIRKRRKTLSITQRDVATLSGIGVNTLTKIERGEVNISFKAVMSVLDALGLDVEIRLKVKR